MSEEIKNQSEEPDDLTNGEDREALEAAVEELDDELDAAGLDESDEDGVIIYDADAEDALEEERARAESERQAEAC